MYRYCAIFSYTNRMTNHTLVRVMESCFLKYLPQPHLQIGVLSPSDFPGWPVSMITDQIFKFRDFLLPSLEMCLQISCSVDIFFSLSGQAVETATWQQGVGFGF